MPINAVAVALWIERTENKEITQCLMDFTKMAKAST